MRFWIVQKNVTVEAIFQAIEEGRCTTEAQVEAIASAYKDSVQWANPWPSEETEEKMEEGTEQEQPAPRKFTPQKEKTYQNINGYSYRCLNASKFSPYRATMQQPNNLWTFTAVDCRLYEDGRIEWAYSTNGFFAKEEKSYGPEE